MISAGIILSDADPSLLLTPTNFSSNATDPGAAFGTPSNAGEQHAAVLLHAGDVPAGNIGLYAPRGYVDAGDAGIRASGNLNIGALEVLNANNISVQGKSIGVPTVVAPNTGAITAASNTSGAATTVANEVTKQVGTTKLPDIPSVITVEVMGYGGG